MAKNVESDKLSFRQNTGIKVSARLENRSAIRVCKTAIIILYPHLPTTFFLRVSLDRTCQVTLVKCHVPQMTLDIWFVCNNS